jgi:hypothetical protein
LWGSEAVEPYKVALRRRRYDWAWSATALYAMFEHLNELLPDNISMFALLPEPEPSFMTSAITAAQTAGFLLQSVAMRTEHDPVQIIWKSGQKSTPATIEVESVRKAMHEFLSARGEPAGYLHLHLAGLIACAQSNSLKQPEVEFDETLRRIQNLFETALKANGTFIHYSSGEGVDTGMWGLSISPKDSQNESLSDRVEVAVVNYLQKTPAAIFLDVEEDLYPRFPGLMAPSKGLIYAVLNSYAEKDGARWKLRAEDIATARRNEMEHVFKNLATLGKRLKYQSTREDKILNWKENGKIARKFNVLASALLGRALENADEQTVFVIPGGRAALAAYKQMRDPSLGEEMKKYRLVKYRLLRTLLEVPILTRETFEEQIASDPVEESKGQMMMF